MNVHQKDTRKIGGEQAQVVKFLVNILIKKVK